VNEQFKFCEGIILDAFFIRIVEVYNLKKQRVHANMVKGWADHSSSEEEEEFEHSTAFVELDAPLDAGKGSDQPQIHPPDGDEHEAIFVERTYEYPTEPPYTAYVGNLSYSITDSPMFVDAMTKLVLEQLQVEMKFKNARMFSDPSSNYTRHRGFGYIEVETVEDLQKLMELNKCEHPAIDGRRITVDTSTQKGGGHNKSHGSQNKHERRRPSNSSNNQSNNRRNSSRSITSTHSDAASEGPKFRGGRHHNNNNSYSSISSTKQSDTPLTSNDAPLSASSSQRPVLKLKPRSKPIDGEQKSDAAGTDMASGALGGSSSSIFGAAKPRDGQSWLSQKESTKATAAVSTSTSETEEARNNNTNQEKGFSTPSSQYQHQSGRDLKNSGRGSGTGRTGSKEGRGGTEGNNRGSGRAYSGRGINNSNATGDQNKYNRNKGSDSAPTTASKGKSGHKKAEATAAPVPTPPPSKPIEPEKKVPTKPANIFAALALDDSDSD
jgi:hypothetical protein